MGGTERTGPQTQQDKDTDVPEDGREGPGGPDSRTGGLGPGCRSAALATHSDTSGRGSPARGCARQGARVPPQKSCDL